MCKNGRRIRHFTDRKHERQNMKLSVVIPCYNEANTIEELIDAVLSAPYPDKEIIIVDDHSTDGTRQILEDRIAAKVSRIIYQKQNQGKGAALREGIRAATGDVVIIQDADLEYDPAEYPKMIEPILNDKADVVFGSRFMGGEPHRVGAGSILQSEPKRFDSIHKLAKGLKHQFQSI